MAEKKFHSAAKASLKTQLLEVLNKTIIKDQWVENDITKWGHAFSLAIAKNKKSILTSEQAWLILLRNVLKVCEEIENEEEVSLSNLISTDILADKILGLYETYPRSYSILFPLNLEKNEKLGTHSLNSDVDLIEIDRESPLLSYSLGQVESTLSALAGLGEVRPKPLFKVGQHLLKINTSGYGERSVDDSAIANAISFIKGLIFISKSFEVVKCEGNWLRWQDENVLYGKCFVVDNDDPDGNIKAVDLPQELQEHFACYYVGKKQETDIRGEKVDFRLHILSIASQILGSDTPKENNEALSTALVWALDSLSSKNQTVSFIQLCISLEALLGDEHGAESLSKTLADRCAYLLGKTPMERREIREKFSDLYRLRSKLVHGRKRQIDSESREALFWGNKIISRLIKKEVSNLKKSLSL